MDVTDRLSGIANRLTGFGADSDFELDTVKIEHGDVIRADIETPWMGVKSGYLRQLRRPSESSKFVYLSHRAEHGDVISLPVDCRIIQVDNTGGGFYLRSLTPKKLWGTGGSTEEFIFLTRRLRDGDSLDAVEESRLLDVLPTQSGFTASLLVPTSAYENESDNE